VWPYDYNEQNNCTSPASSLKAPGLLSVSSQARDVDPSNDSALLASHLDLLLAIHLDSDLGNGELR
jgi:hypothetical protein